MATRKTARREAAREAPGEDGHDEPKVWVPTMVFFTHGVGTHETQRVAMQRAMEEAGVAECNMVKVSSVIPPNCRIISREHGRRLLRSGGIVHAVIAQGETNEPHQRVTAALCFAQPDSDRYPGFITEVEEEETKGKSAKTATDEAGEALLTIVAEKIRAKVDAKKLWAKRGRDRKVRVGRETVRVGAITATAIAPEKQGDTERWAVAMAFAVYL